MASFSSEYLPQTLCTIASGLILVYFTIYFARLIIRSRSRGMLVGPQPVAALLVALTAITLQVIYIVVTDSEVSFPAVEDGVVQTNLSWQALRIFGWFIVWPAALVLIALIDYDFLAVYRVASLAHATGQHLKNVAAKRRVVDMADAPDEADGAVDNVFQLQVMAQKHPSWAPWTSVAADAPPDTTLSVLTTPPRPSNGSQQGAGHRSVNGEWIPSPFRRLSVHTHDKPSVCAAAVRWLGPWAAGPGAATALLWTASQLIVGCFAGAVTSADGTTRGICFGFGMAGLVVAILTAMNKLLRLRIRLEAAVSSTAEQPLGPMKQNATLSSRSLPIGLRSKWEQHVLLISALLVLVWGVLVGVGWAGGSGLRGTSGWSMRTTQTILSISDAVLLLAVLIPVVMFHPPTKPSVEVLAASIHGGSVEGSPSKRPHIFDRLAILSAPGLALVELQTAISDLYVELAAATRQQVVACDRYQHSPQSDTGAQRSGLEDAFAAATEVAVDGAQRETVSPAQAVRASASPQFDMPSIHNDDEAAMTTPAGRRPDRGSNYTGGSVTSASADDDSGAQLRVSGARIVRYRSRNAAITHSSEELFGTDGTQKRTTNADENHRLHEASTLASARSEHAAGSYEADRASSDSELTDSVEETVPTDLARDECLAAGVAQLTVNTEVHNPRETSVPSSRSAGPLYTRHVAARITASMQSMLKAKEAQEFSFKPRRIASWKPDDSPYSDSGRVSAPGRGSGSPIPKYIPPRSGVDGQGRQLSTPSPTSLSPNASVYDRLYAEGKARDERLKHLADLTHAVEEETIRRESRSSIQAPLPIVHPDRLGAGADTALKQPNSEAGATLPRSRSLPQGRPWPRDAAGRTSSQPRRRPPPPTKPPTGRDSPARRATSRRMARRQNSRSQTPDGAAARRRRRRPRPKPETNAGRIRPRDSSDSGVSMSSGSRREREMYARLYVTDSVTNYAFDDEGIRRPGGSTTARSLPSVASEGSLSDAVQRDTAVPTNALRLLLHGGARGGSVNGAESVGDDMSDGSSSMAKRVSFSVLSALHQDDGLTLATPTGRAASPASTASLDSDAGLMAEAKPTFDVAARIPVDWRVQAQRPMTWSGRAASPLRQHGAMFSSEEEGGIRSAHAGEGTPVEMESVPAAGAGGVAELAEAPQTGNQKISGPGDRGRLVHDGHDSKADV